MPVEPGIMYGAVNRKICEVGFEVLTVAVMKEGPIFLYTNTRCYIPENRLIQNF
jgi:hypothetical protein